MTHILWLIAAVTGGCVAVFAALSIALVVISECIRDDGSEETR